MRRYSSNVTVVLIMMRLTEIYLNEVSWYHKLLKVLAGSSDGPKGGFSAER